MSTNEAIIETPATGIITEIPPDKSYDKATIISEN